MRAVVVSVSALLLTSCGTAPKTPSDAASGEGTTINCGEVVAEPIEDLAEVGAKEITCLETALHDHASATLEVTATTKEGDPVVTTWTLTRDGRLTQDVDASQDRFAGGQRTFHGDCGVVTAIPDPLDCAPR